MKRCWCSGLSFGCGCCWTHVQCDGERWDEGCGKMGWLFLWLESRCLVGWNIKIDGEEDSGEYSLVMYVGV